MGGDCKANIISRFDELIVAEFPAMGTPLVGKTLAESKLRENFGVNVVGIWERGRFEIPRAKSRIERTSVLVLAGSEKNLAAYDDIYAFYHICHLSVDPVLIVGSGRVGDTIAQRFKERGSPYLVIEKNPKRLQDEEHYVVGMPRHPHAARAPIEKAPAAHHHPRDATNIYLPRTSGACDRTCRSSPRKSGSKRLHAPPRRVPTGHVLCLPVGQRHLQLPENEDTSMLAEGLEHLPPQGPGFARRQGPGRARGSAK